MFDVASFMRLVVVRSSSSSPATVGAALSLSGVDAPTVGACDAKQVDACGRLGVHVQRTGNFGPDVLRSEPSNRHMAERAERDTVLLRGWPVAVHAVSPPPVDPSVSCSTNNAAHNDGRTDVTHDITTDNPAGRSVTERSSVRNSVFRCLRCFEPRTRVVVTRVLNSNWPLSESNRYALTGNGF